MKVEIVIQVKNIAHDSTSPFVNSNMRAVVDVDRENPTTVVSEMIIAAEAAVRRIK